MGNPGNNLRADRLAVIFLMASAASVFFPVLSSINKLSDNSDALQIAAHHRLIRESLLRDRQFPLRTSYFGGGYPTIAAPEDPSFSPSVLFTLILGETAGIKLYAFAIFLI